MRKIFITFFIFILSINIVSAGDCTIKDKTSPSLLEYIKNNRTVIKNIWNELLDSKDNWENSLKKEADEEYDKVKSSSLKIYNQIFNFDWYYSYFKYFAVFPISNEVPYQVKRDYRLLSSESEWIKFYLNNIVKSWKTEFVIKDACKWIENSCNLWKNIKAWELIWKLTENNNAVMDLFRNTVIWEIDKNKTKIDLVNKNFELEIQTNYNIESYSKCSENWWFFEKISKAIKEISILNKEWKDWVQKWRDAIDLMLWNDTKNEKYTSAEKRLLKNELSKQWIYWDSQNNALEALDKYNSEWFSKDNNFITNTFNNTRIKLEKKLREFKEEVIWDFFTKNKNSDINVNTSISAQKNSTNTNKIKENIDKMYLELLNFEWISELSTANLRNKLINVHIDLSNSINTLEESCPKAVAICNQQNSWKWVCWKCN